MASSERVEPLGQDQRFVDGPLLTAWWAATSIGVPGLLIGMDLAHPDGLGLSLGQIILLVPIGTLIAGALAAVVAGPGASVGVPFGLLVRPSLGVGLGSAVGALRGLLYVALLAWQFSIVLDVASDSFGSGGSLYGLLGVVIVAAVLFAIGTNDAVEYYIRWPAFWGGIFVAFGVLWRISSFELGFISASGTGFWVGVDQFVWLFVILAPLIVDTARLVDRDSVAPSAVAFGFSVPTVLIVVGGASLAAATGLQGPGAFAAVFGAGTTIALILGLAWLLFAEVDQAFSLSYSAELELATLTRAVPRLVGSVVMLVAAAGAAVVLSTETLQSTIDWGVRLLAPVLAVMIVDYYFVRHARYETDDLFRVGGEYQLVNVAGVLGWLAGVAFAEWLDPLVLTTVGWEERFVDAPITLGSIAVAALVYAVAGRLLVHEQEYVADLRL